MSLLFLLKYFLRSSSHLLSLCSLYRSGLWRQKTLAWWSPEAVTARVASLKDTSTTTRKINPMSNFDRDNTSCGNSRTCWWWSQGPLRRGHDTRTPCCPSERPIGAALRLSSKWTPQKKTLPTAGERCQPGGTQGGGVGHGSSCEQLAFLTLNPP